MEIIRLDIPDRLSIFQLPNTSNSKGFQLGDWKQQIWEGGLKIFETNDDKLIIRFYSQDGKQFAMLEVPENYEDGIVKCEDSVRGYALRLVNPKGGYTWIGLGFRDRNTAFDFRSRIVDFSERKMQDSQKSKDQFQKVEDMRLNTGEKISMSIGGMQSKNSTQQSKVNQDLSSFHFGMPGQTFSAQNAVKPPATTTQQAEFKSFSSGGWDDWSNFGNSSTQPQQQQNVNLTGQKQTDFFGDFNDFGNFGNFNQPQQQNNANSTNENNNNNMNAWGFGGNNNQPAAQQQYQQPQQQQYQQQQQQQPAQNKPSTINLLDL